jgi:exopolyphosphatase/guanosine-5'-triphosphate,3'-diphosphate pyrophosphatase
MVNSLASAESNRIIAAIDMGTNSFHMVVARIDPKLPAFTIIAREKDTVRLGDCEANITSPKLCNSSQG